MKDDKKLKDQVLTILALSFLPPNIIEEEFFRIKAEMKEEYRALLQTWLDYFEDYWINTVTPEGFSIFELSRRTNNIEESYNSLLADELGHRPEAAPFIRNFIIISLRTRTEICS